MGDLDETIDAATVHAGPDGQTVHADDPPVQLAVEALDRWILDLGDEEADLRRQLRQAQATLTSPPDGPDGGAETEPTVPSS
jgi:hypothetical protein